ncbi:tetratricopeptide repeat protein [candidate division TA06 bacterium]|nr:tetratricopeptide repeat protein [candidate division TA06 bacterium]
MSDPLDNNIPEQMVNDPSSQLFASLADFYRENGLYSEAIAICQAGLESQPDNIEGRLVLSKCLLATKQYSLARAEAAKVLSVQSEHSEAKKVLAQADSAVPEAEAPAPAPVKVETAAITEIPPKAKPPEESALPEAVVKKEEPLPEPVKISEPPAREIPSSPLPLMAGRTDPNSVPVQKTEDQPAEIPPEPKAPPAASDKPQKFAAEETTEWQAGFGKIMNDLVQTPQVKACMLVDENGYAVADSVSRSGQSLSEDSAALSANIFKTAFEALKKIKLGELERIVIETGDEKIFLRQAGRMVLMISADSSAKVGLVMVNSKRAAEQAENLAKKEPNR